jgi:hypothetical protein
MLLALAGLARLGLAEAVTLKDGTVLKGKVTTEANGDYSVATAAGDIMVSKDKVASVMTEGPAEGTEPALRTKTMYGEELEARRRKYGNEDGLHHESLLAGSQLFFTLGETMYNGDALDTSGSFKTSDFNGINIGFTLVNDWMDNVGVELWGGYSPSTKKATLTGAPRESHLDVNRLDLGFSPRLQALIPLGEQGFFVTPHIGLGPMATLLLVSSTVVDSAGAETHPFDGSALGLGAAIHAGVDVQLGLAVFSAKVRYMLSYVPTGSLNTNNLGGLVPEAGFGWAF